jgi:uncharacterized membrane protein YeaQ/YmgE (transglycosylase-associated protein family)
MEGKAEYNAGIELLRRINPDSGRVGLGQVKSSLGAENVRTGMDTADWCGGGRNSEVRATGEESGGLVVAVMVGLAGSFLAAYLGERFAWYRQGEADGIIMCAVGAIVALAIFRFLSGTTAGSGGRENYDL